jgi:hypothetical protein
MAMQMDRQTDETKPIISFPNFANTLKKGTKIPPKNLTPWYSLS